jgi:cytochrome c-type biogenesis protein CcmH/NrfG
MSHHSHGKPQAVPAGYWSSTQSYVLAVITLLLGVAVGYLVRGSATAETAGQNASSSGFASSLGNSNLGQQSDLTARAVAPLLERLNTRPNDPELLISIANTYYDGKDYPHAIDYYQKALKLTPQNVSVRTDMATAMWYSGDADGAIKQYELSLKVQPTHPQTLFNMGIVRWQGKKDAKGAVEVWEKLLAANPEYSDRPKVQQLIDQVKLEKGKGS